MQRMQLPDPRSTGKPGAVPYARIATEEAFAPPAMMDIYRRLLERGGVDPGFRGLMGFYMSSPAARAQHIMRCLTDLDQLRLEHMDACGIDRQVLALTSPGVQVMDNAAACPTYNMLASEGRRVVAAIMLPGPHRAASDSAGRTPVA